MTREILRAWLSGEKTLPVATRDWIADHTREDLASVAGYFLLQAIIGSLLVAVARQAVQVSAATVQSSSPAMMAVLALLSVITVTVMALLMEVRKVGRFVERFVVNSGNCEPGWSDTAKGKLHTNGVKIDDSNMSPDSNGGENP